MLNKFEVIGLMFSKPKFGDAVMTSQTMVVRYHYYLY